MLSLDEPSALLSNARLTIATLIQRPSTITTSNAFDEFSILDHLIDVSNDVDRFEDGENRKFLNIAQVITASTCIYSRRVDALYKLINTFQSSSPNEPEENNQSEEDETLISGQQEEEEEEEPKKILQEKKKKIKEINRSFICNDLSKINLNPSKTFFLDRTSLFDLKLFQKHVPLENKQFWLNDNRPMIFDLLFDENQLLEITQQPEQLIDVLHQSPQPIFNDIPLPIDDNNDDDNVELSWNNNNNQSIIIEKKKSIRNRRKKIKNDLDLNIFRHGLTDEQQTLFSFPKFKSLSNKIKIEQTLFFNKTFNRKHFDGLIKDSSLSIFIYPIITIHHLNIRERYSLKLDQPPMIYSPSIPITEVFNEDFILPDIQEDVDIRLQTDMEQILDAAIIHSSEEQEHNKIFLELRSLILSYMNKYDSTEQINVNDLFEKFHEKYSLSLIFSQLLHLCGSTQRYHLNSTSEENLFIEKIL